MSQLSDDARAGFVLNIDKPAGMTSFRIVQAVRRIVGIRKVGHTGTLDPAATGVLIVCTGKATKQIESLMAHDKEYTGAFRLGETTDTYDGEGTVTRVCDTAPFALSELEAAAELFRGGYDQIPPMYSALKHNGQPLYKLARKGVEIPRASRSILLKEFSLGAYEHPLLDFRVRCSKGTYVRSLAHDFGQVLGCGAHLASLRRTRNGNFLIDTAIPLHRLADHLMERTLA